MIKIAKTSKSSLGKCKIDEIAKELPLLESIDYLPLEAAPRKPVLILPESLDIDSPYALFSLFISDDMFETISKNTNAYARIKQAGEMGGWAWKNTCAQEIKVFFGILIYMGVHQSPRTEHYWQQNETQGPMHLSQQYMTLKQFEQLKHYIHISHPDQQPKSRD